MNSRVIYIIIHRNSMRRRVNARQLVDEFVALTKTSAATARLEMSASNDGHAAGPRTRDGGHPPTPIHSHISPLTAPLTSAFVCARRRDAGVGNRRRRRVWAVILHKGWGVDVGAPGVLPAVRDEWWSVDRTHRAGRSRVLL